MELPDGTNLFLGNERFRCTEGYFQPKTILGLDMDTTLPRLIAQSLMQCIQMNSIFNEHVPSSSSTGGTRNLLSHLPSEILGFIDDVVTFESKFMKDMRNIVLSGGPSLFPGMEEHLHQEIKLLLPKVPIKVITSLGEQQHHQVWIGGSMQASPEHVQNQFISKQDYDEFGPDVILWKGW